MGLTEDGERFATIRKTAATLLQKSGISLLSATDADVQKKKRDLANELEKLFPKEFGITTGVDRDYTLQKDTSYAILTITMDCLKRELKMKAKLASGAKPSVRRKSRVRDRRYPSRSKSTVIPEGSTPVEEQLLASTSAADPPRALASGLESISKPTTSPELVSTPTPALDDPANQPGPIAAKDIVLIFRSDCARLNIYSPMSWTEMISPGSDKPCLSKVHENLTEDGLEFSRNEYTLLNPEGQPVRSDRCLNYVLDRYRTLGNVESDWRVVQNCNLVFPDTPEL